ncbi:TonB-dependent receptor [Paracidobacterium acidisoli]|uniref:TonB-dependent transporter Oar-like beta-barrel domain-containing protein n=1 Tax=Paracidobacterium acidisoli TaxID=2303751 RepID=A0A372IS09_9BACT|nr:TonB-dependent receptor [Paracidobacterium acidisoli]MBT9330608.1 TonB-dependent receptor [Paracidobacterium acidisoli]
MKCFFRRGVRWYLAAILLMHCSFVLAQVNISGIVQDPDGAAIPNAEVLLRPSNSGAMDAKASTTTDAAGRFHFAQVAAGEYNLEIPSKYGFERYDASLHVIHGLHELQVQLTPSVVTQNVTVASEVDQIALDPSSNRDQISTDARMLETVPVFDQDYIAALTPFLDQTGISTSGVSIIVDGVEMKGTGVSASAIAEAHINNDPYSAETNRPGKGRIEIITKPGSSKLHGTLNFTFRDSAFDAKNYFAATKPFEQKRIYEGSVTGPVHIDNKTTFLLSGSRQEDNLQSIVHAGTPSGLVTANVPTPVHDTEFAARISHDVSTVHRVSLQYNVTDTVSENLGAGGLVLAQGGVNAQAREDDVIFNDRIVISPTLLNQLQLFFEKDHNPTRSVVAAQKIVVDGAFTSGGAQGDLLNTENNLKINDIVSWNHSHHYVKFGVNIPNLSRRAWEDDSNRLGTFSFSSLADYEANTPYSFTQQSGIGRAVFWMNEIGAFIQDQIQIRPNLQASVGLRYDWQTYFKSIHDFAPRLSLSYAMPNRRTILRAGAGIFYDRSGAPPMADLKRYNGVILRAFTLLDPGYPVPYSAGINPASLPTNLVRLANGTRLPYVTNYSAGIERQLAKGTTLAVTYRGTVGIAMFRSRDVNAPLPPYDQGRPNPELGVVRQIESEGRQMGNAMDITLSSNANRWFSGLAQYTFSHTNNNTGGITWFPANQYSFAGEYARADFDQRHRFNLLGTIHEDHWLNLGIAAKLYSGTPYTETSGNDTFNTGILNARPAGIDRNTLESGGNAEFDLRWSHELWSYRKSSDKTPSFSLAFDAFNITNRTNYTSYVGNVQSSFFEQPTAAMPGRRLQFTGRIKF